MLKKRSITKEAMLIGECIMCLLNIRKKSGHTDAEFHKHMDCSKATLNRQGTWDREGTPMPTLDTELIIVRGMFGRMGKKILVPVCWGLVSILKAYLYDIASVEVTQADEKNNVFSIRIKEL